MRVAAAALALVLLLAACALWSPSERCALCPPVACVPTDPGTCPDGCGCVASGPVGVCGGI